MEHTKFDNFIIKTPETQEERNKLYSLNRTAHDDKAANMVKKLIECHPDINEEHFLMAVDSENGNLASTLSMIPWKLSYYNTHLKCLEMGFVATDKNYQKKGLQVKLNEQFYKCYLEGGYDISIIQGIPGFYSKFGYHFAIPLENHIFLDLYNIEKYEGNKYSITMAQDKDIEAISTMYTDHISSYDIASLNSEKNIRYAMNTEYNGETDSEYYIVWEGNTIAGYFKITLYGFSEGLLISEASDMEYEAYMAVLSFLKSKAVEREKPYLKLTLPEFHNLSKIGFTLGGRLQWNYEWQVKINLRQFFHSISPVLEKRIEESIFKGLTYKLAILLYESGISLEFKNGRIVSIDDYWQQQEECSITIQSFYKLLLGSASLNELKKIDNEIFMTPKNHLILDTLFQKGSAYLYVPY